MYFQGNKYPCFIQRPELEYREEGESGEKKIYLLIFGRGRNPFKSISAPTLINS